jgi:pyrroloquinoline quinone (PQQ) biosynthesis protein C
MAEPLPVEEYLREVDALVAAHDPGAIDRVLPAIAAGRASRDVVRRVVLEHYCVAKWISPDLAVLIANAPDVYSFTMEDSAHYRHWARRFAGATGYLGGANHVQAAIDWCRQLGVDDDAVRRYTPLPETIAMTFTLLFSVRRSYEEGLAILGYVAERLAPGHDPARMLAEGLAAHYGVTVTAADEAQDATEAGGAELFRRVAITRVVQDRCRDAVRNFLLTAECRARAMNRWIA